MFADWTMAQLQWTAFTVGLAVAVLFILVKELSAAASRAYFAEKEKHIKRVVATINEEDEHE